MTRDYIKTLVAQVLRKKPKRVSSGSYGTYTRINAQYGIKWVGGMMTSYDEARKSEYFKKMLKEAAVHRVASKRTDIIAKYYACGIFQISDKFVCGIVMEHIVRRYIASRRKTYELQDKLSEFGIKYTDANEENFLYDRNNKKWRVIDFSPGWTYLKPLPIAA